MRELPSTALLRGLTPMLSRVVSAAYIDRNAHLNVRGYFELQIEASATSMRNVGLTDEYVRERRLGLFTAEHHISYLAEVAEGQHVTGYVKFHSRSKKALRNVVFLVNDTTDKLASLCEVVIVHVDQVSRRPTDIPADLADAIDAMIEVSLVVPWPPPASSSVGSERPGVVRGDQGGHRVTDVRARSI